MTPSASTSDLHRAFAPTGRLRACINLGNAVLARAGEGSSGPVGISIDLAHALARSLGLPIELVVVDLASKAVDAVAQDNADVGFFAIDPLRGAAIAFTAPYLLIEGSYLVRNESALHANDEVDVAGHTVAVGKGSAYDLYLTRTLAHATIVRARSSQAVVDSFVDQRLDVAAGVRQQLESDAQRLGGLRLLPGRFMVIRQAMGVPKSRGALAASHLAAFVEQMKASGFVVDALRRHGIEGASVAGPGDADRDAPPPTSLSASR